ncbi:hypothetical protein R3P38DRAFT_3354035, partial [Favolaschia claudopus]
MGCIVFHGRCVSLLRQPNSSLRHRLSCLCRYRRQEAIQASGFPLRFLATNTHISRLCTSLRRLVSLRLSLGIIPMASLQVIPLKVDSLQARAVPNTSLQDPAPTDLLLQTVVVVAAAATASLKQTNGATPPKGVQFSGTSSDPTASRLAAPTHTTPQYSLVAESACGRGHVADVFCAVRGDSFHVKVPVGKHCGFVQFVRKADAERAIKKMQGFPVGGSRIRLSWGRSQ